MTTLDQAIAQMCAAGMPDLPPDHPRLNTERIVRYGPKKKAWYRLYEFRARNDRVYISGAFGMWGVVEAMKVEANFEGMDAAERERLEQAQRSREESERLKRAKRADFAAHRARKQWLSAQSTPPAGDGHYLARKSVPAERGLKFFADGTLLVPMIDYAVEKPVLRGLQKIQPDGTKRFNAGMVKEGTACRIGVKPRDGETVLVAEGVATALSVRLATEQKVTVFVAFDCYNLLAVGRMLRAALPASRVIFCADDDFQTEGNPGMMRAEAAAAAIGDALVVSPQFVDRGDRKLTDFNDLQVAENVGQVKKQIDAALARAGAAAAKPVKKKPKASGPGIDWGRFFKRYTLIYPTETAWDAEVQKIVKVSAMRLHWGKQTIEFWLSSPDRKTVNEEGVVFDPSCTCDPETTVNLFSGLDLKPAPGKCEKLLELLQFLCGEGGQDQAPVTDWVLNWMAYPLQHRGAKMRSAVVMYGGEGTGKNLFWSALSEIYSPYSGFITQFQLQSQFNDWASRKMFVVANEVLTRMELKHLVGYLKNLVTEERIPIEAKNMPVRLEDNHMQLVFLSNELRPLHISPGDRRYMVIRTPNGLALDYYAGIAAELASGGAAALYDFLLTRDLGDFNEHTKPIETSAKRDLIELGLSSTQLFWNELHDELLPIPYAPCLSTDLYRAYTAWCMRNGEKVPQRVNQFSHEFMSMNGVTRKLERVPDPDNVAENSQSSDTWRQRTCFLMGKVPPEIKDDGGVAYKRWMREQIGVFRGHLRDYLGDRGVMPKSDIEGRGD